MASDMALLSFISPRYGTVTAYCVDLAREVMGDGRPARIADDDAAACSDEGGSPPRKSTTAVCTPVPILQTSKAKDLTTQLDSKESTTQPDSTRLTSTSVPIPQTSEQKA